LATKKRKNVQEQKDGWAERHRNGQRMESARAHHKIPEQANEASGREFAKPEMQDCRGNTAYSQQRKDEADNVADLPFDHASMIHCRLAVRLPPLFRICVFSVEIQRRSGFANMAGY
jgi:hypothetical protein